MRSSVSGAVLIAVGLTSVIGGIAAGLAAIPALTSRSSSHDISKIAPAPVLEPWVEAQVTVDARSRSAWVYFDFSRGSVVTDAVVDGHNWDLAFQRFRVATNSGTTNPNGHAGVIKVAAGDKPQKAPRDGYRVDEWESLGRGAAAITHNQAFRRWYRFSPRVMGLVSRGHYYIIRTADGGYVRFQFVSYRCPGAVGGGMGCVTFRYGYRSDFSRVLGWR